MASLAAYLRKYDPLAAGWSEASSSLSLDEWLNGESVIVLGLDERVRAPLSAIYRLFLQRLADVLLGQPDRGDVRTWLFMDEVRHLAEGGIFTALRSLMTCSRSKGVANLLGFQDVEGMHHAFGEKEANEIIGQCATIAALRTQSVRTAQWESDLFGDAEWLEEPITKGPQGTSSTEQKVRRRIVLPGQFMSLPMAGPEHGIPGWFTSSAIGTWEGPIPWDDLLKGMPTEKSGVPNFVPRSPESEYLKPWAAEERARIAAALNRHKRRQPPRS
jgi:hypothetical protein